MTPKVSANERLSAMLPTNSAVSNLATPIQEVSGEGVSRIHSRAGKKRLKNIDHNEVMHEVAVRDAKKIMQKVGEEVQNQVEFEIAVSGQVF